MQTSAAERLIELYPKIFFACHVRHVKDPDSENVLTANQASILDHLDPDEPMSLNGLAQHMGVTPATMCVAVDRLEKLGYVWRERSESDRRKVLLRVTPAGVKLRQAQSVLEPDRVRDMLAMLSQSELERGIRGFELIAEAADRFLASRGPGWKDLSDEANP